LDVSKILPTLKEYGENMKLVMAPLLAITDLKYRNVYNHFFPEFDYAITPFVSLPDGNRLTSKVFRDFIPEKQEMDVVPQLLNHNAESFISACNYLAKWNYSEINLNMGCPDRGVMNKGRGASLLDTPDKLDSVLEKLFRGLDREIVSIKIRGGKTTFKNFQQLIQVINRYPFKNVTLHPRTASQMYEGNVNLDIVEQAVAGLKHELIYSGDIYTFEDYQKLNNRFPEIAGWMLGRGMLGNPFLAQFIRQGNNRNYDLEKLYNWYNELYTEFKNFGRHEMYVLGRMKAIWKYMCYSFADSERILKEVLTCLDAEKFLLLTNNILEKEEFLGNR
jgi:tRNA-dihydrouridine synthase